MNLTSNKISILVRLEIQQKTYNSQSVFFWFPMKHLQERMSTGVTDSPSSFLFKRLDSAPVRTVSTITDSDSWQDNLLLANRFVRNKIVHPDVLMFSKLRNIVETVGVFALLNYMGSQKSPEKKPSQSQVFTAFSDFDFSTLTFRTSAPLLLFKKYGTVSVASLTVWQVYESPHVRKASG